MQIELIGCTGAGKSTLASHIRRICRAQGIDAWTSYDLVLRQVQLDWVENKLVRGMLVNLIALLVCLMTWRKNLEFYRFAIRTIWRLPVAVAWFEKLYIGRDVLKNIGIYEIVRRRAGDRRVIVLDEGPLHTAHYLFVHVAVEPDPSDLAAFVGRAPLPDVVVYVTQSESVLIERTLDRGHKRIKPCSHAAVARFVRHAVATFDWLAQQPELAGRLLVVDGRLNQVVGRDNLESRPFSMELEIVRDGLAAVAAERLGGVISVSGIER